MTIVLRILLIVAAILVVSFMLRGVKKSKMRIEDIISWTGIAAVIIILALFPQIGDALAKLTGIQSTQNFIFLFFIFLLFVKAYHQSRTVSELQTKVRELSEQIALDRLDHYERNQSKESR